MSDGAVCSLTAIGHGVPEKLCGYRMWVYLVQLYLVQPHGLGGEETEGPSLED